MAGRSSPITPRSQARLRCMPHSQLDCHAKCPTWGEAAQRTPLLARPLQPVPTWGGRLLARLNGSGTALNQDSPKTFIVREVNHRDCHQKRHGPRGERSVSIVAKAMGRRANAKLMPLCFPVAIYKQSYCACKSHGTLAVDLRAGG
jgi:hypothetical protein